MSRYAKSQLERFGRDRLSQILREEYDLVAEDDDTKEDLVRLIVEQQAAADYKRREDEELAGEPEKPAETTRDIQPWRKDRVRVQFDEQPGPDGRQPIKASLNGIAYSIPRGVDVDIPRDVLRGCIDNARMTIYEPVEDAQGRVRVEKREVPRVTYRVVQDPAPAKRQTSAA